MRSVLRFILFWRYLLLVCLVLAFAIDYLFTGSLQRLFTQTPQAAVSSAAQPSMREKYDRIEFMMTEAQVEEILGPPQSKVEVEQMDFKIMSWREGEDAISIYFIWTETGKALNKKY